MESRSDIKFISFGSCFATEIGTRMKEDGYEITNNPFGVLYNPASISNSINRLIKEKDFTIDEVIDRDPLYGKNAGCMMAKSYASYYHHSRFAAPSPEEFLEKANNELHNVAAAFRKADVVIITFGTTWVFRNIERDIIVSNCHKRPAYEFRREFLSIEEIFNTTASYINYCSEAPPQEIAPKKWIFTVSPIRHLKDGLHGNQLSKATLLLSEEKLANAFSNVLYFPSYEIVIDELRDYRYYNEDQTHPSSEAVDYVYKKFRHYLSTI
jgi:hypothetical protein